MRTTVLKFLAHANIVLAVMFIVFAVITTQNTTMGFLTDEMSLSLLGIFCLAALLMVALFAFELAEIRRSDRIASVFGKEPKDRRTANRVFLGSYVGAALSFALSVVFIALMLIGNAIGPDEIMNSLKTVYALTAFCLADLFLAVNALFTVRKSELECLE